MTATISSVPSDVQFHDPSQTRRDADRGQAKASAISHDRHQAFQRLARMTGLLFLVTYITSIPPVLWLYVPALTDPTFILGGTLDSGVSWGALLEILLIVANVGSALTLYPVLKAYSQVLSLGYVVARLTENAFIILGIVAILTLNSLRQTGGEIDNDVLIASGQSLVALHDWTFRLGPGLIVGIGNGLILGYMMWRTRLVPRALSFLGLIGGPALLIAAAAMVFGVIELGSTAQIIATMPEFFWELSFGLWLLIKGFNPTALGALDARKA